MRANIDISILRIAVALCVAPFLACDDLSQATSGDHIKGGSGPLIPLAAGNQWVSVTTHFDTLGNVDTVMAPATLVTITKDTLINGTMWFVHPWLDVQVAYRSSDQGIHTRLVSPNDDTTEFMLHRFPAVLGDTLPYPIVLFNGSNPKYYSNSSQTSQLTSLDTVITVPAGTFRCVRFRVTRHGWPTGTDWYFSKGYGWIRIDGWSTTWPGETVFLESRSDAITITLN